MKPSHSFQGLSYLFGSLFLLFSLSLKSQSCTATDSATFVACLSTARPFTLNVTTNSFRVTLTSMQSLNGVTLDVNNNDLEIRGNPTVDNLTVLTGNGSAGTLIITTNSGSVVFSSSPGPGEFNFTLLNTAMGPNTTLVEAAIAASGGAGSPLPVTLNSFEASNNNSMVALSWQTSAELNNDRFIIETSTEGEVFNRIGEMDGAGTTTETQNYQFIHHTPSAGVNYYRLKQVDFDGTFAYSKVLAINAPGSKDIFAFPNPAKDKITIQYDYSKGTGNIQLYDALGRRIHTTIGGYAGNYEVKLPDGLARGTYWLKVERGGKVQTVPVVKE